MIQILALSGSLRSNSSNTTLLKAAALLTPVNATITLYDAIPNLPHISPDLEGVHIPSVAHFRDHIKAADGILISCPEYGHGVPGAFKNALDWIIGSGEFHRKPVALLNASERANYAFDALWEIIGTMDANLIAEASPTIPIQGKLLDAQAIASNPTFAIPLKEAIQELVKAIQETKTTK